MNAGRAMFHVEHCTQVSTVRSAAPGDRLGIVEGPGQGVDCGVRPREVVNAPRWTRRCPREEPSELSCLYRSEKATSRDPRGRDIKQRVPPLVHPQRQEASHSRRIGRCGKIEQGRAASAREATPADKAADTRGRGQAVIDGLKRLPPA